MQSCFLKPITELLPSWHFLANIYLHNINNRKLEKDVKHQNDVIDVVLVFLLLTLNIFHIFFYVSIVGFEQVNVSWVICSIQSQQWKQQSRRQWSCSGVFIVNFEQLSHIALVFPLLTVNK